MIVDLQLSSIACPRLNESRRYQSKRTSVVLALSVWLFALSLSIPVNAIQASTPKLQGKRLSTALGELQKQGLELIYTTRLVPASLRVVNEPTATAMTERLQQLLEPHGLETVQLSNGSLLVVATESAPLDGGLSLTGELVSTHSGVPLTGALVQIERVEPVSTSRVEPGSGDAPVQQQVTAAGGTFRFDDLEPGAYLLRARRDDHEPAQVTTVVQSAPTRGRRGEAQAQTPLRIALRPRAFVNEELAVRSSQVSLLQSDPAGPLSLSESDVRQLPRLGNDLFRALSLLPGASSSDISAEPMVRGGRTDEVQIILDGQELYRPYHLQDYDNGLSLLDVDSLERVELVAGNFSAVQGDRMGAVLDLRTVTPTDRVVRLGIGVLSVDASLAGTIADRGHFLASLRKGFLEYANRVFSQEEPTFWDGQGKFEWSLGERQEVRAHGLVSDDSLDFSSASDGEFKSLATAYRSTHGWITHQAVLGQSLLVLSSVSRVQQSRDRRGLENEDEQQLDLNDRRQLDINEARQQWSLQIAPDHTLDWGASWRNYETDFSYSAESERRLTLAGPEILPSEPPENLVQGFAGRHLGAFISDRLSLGERFTVETGLRFDRHDPRRDQVWSPRLNLAYQVDAKTVLRAGWGLFRQSQRPYELSVEDGNLTTANTERSEHWLLGFERQLDSPTLEAVRVEAYSRQIDNPRRRYVNLFEPFNVLRELEPDRVGIGAIKSRAQGIEVLLRGSAGSRVDWWLSSELTRSQDFIVATDTGRGRHVERETDQPLATSLLLSVRLPRSWALSLAYRYHTGWPTTPVSQRIEPPGEVPDEDGEGEGEIDGEQSTVTVLDLGPLNSRRLSDYHRLDLRLSRTWELTRGQLTFYTDVQNFANRRNAAGADFSIDDDSGLLVSESERWPGIFPSMGLTWRF